jgi:hypothetical protein
MTRSTLAAVMAAFAGGACAGEICYGPAAPATVAAPPTANTVFDCPIAGSRTLNQLAGLGWRVVRLTPVSIGSGNAATRLVIKRASDAIFANGFESE